MGITKRFAVAAIIVFVAASTAACATGRTPLPHDSSPGIHGSPLLVSGNEAIPTTVHAGSTSVPWRLQRIDDAHNRIYLSADKKQCSVPYASTVEATTTSIKITVHGSKNQEPCTAEMVTLLGYVQLTTPLGGRSVLHAAISSP
jgi:hypothetical protein